MNSFSDVERLIADSSEGFFDAPDVREDLHVVLRVASDFYDFMQRSKVEPDATEIAYMIGTIRSGIDECFALAHLCATIDSENQMWKPPQQVNWTFWEVRQRFLEDFEALVSSTGGNPIEKLFALLALTRLEFAFIAHYFPWAVVSHTTGGPQAA